MSRLTVCAWRDAPPSTAYAASVHGEPTKPSSVAWPPISAESARSVSPVNARFSAGLKSPRAARGDLGAALGRAHGVVDARAGALDDVEVDAHRGQRREDVG